MSYASVAASGPSQSEEEKRAHPVAEIEHSEADVQSLIDVDSPHVSSVPSDFESQRVQTDTQAERERLENEAHEKAEELKQKAAEEKAKAKAAGKKAKANSDNPVVIGNAVAIAALGGLLGFGAYKKYTAGQLTWKLAGAWTGLVGLFAVGDYYVSQYFFKKYPTK